MHTHYELYIQTVYYYASETAYKQAKYITKHDRGHNDCSKNNHNDNLQIHEHVGSLYYNVTI